MPPLSDPERLAAYKDALANWGITDYVEFELTEQAHRWIRRELAGVTLKEMKRLMFEYVNDGGEIDETEERREQWAAEWEFHHDLRFIIQGKRVYIETRLKYRLPVVQDESSILVVDVHEW